MIEPSWIVGPGAIWHHRLERPRADVPIRRGTARRLGLKLPPPDVVYTVSPDLSRLGVSMAELAAPGLSILAGVRASFEAFTRQVKETP